MARLEPGQKARIGVAQRRADRTILFARPREVMRDPLRRAGRDQHMHRKGAREAVGGMGLFGGAFP